MSENSENLVQSENIYVSMAELREAEYQKSLEEIDRMVDHFGSERSKYAKYEELITTLLRVQKGALPHPKIFAFVSLGIALLNLIIAIFSKNYSVGQYVGSILMVIIYAVTGICLMLRYIHNKTTYQNQCVAIREEIASLSATLLAHYEAYGNCPLAIEYTDPNFLTELKFILHDRKSTTISGAMTALMNGSGRTIENVQNELATHSAAQNKGMETESVAFLSRDFFNKRGLF